MDVGVGRLGALGVIRWFRAGAESELARRLWTAGHCPSQEVCSIAAIGVDGEATEAYVGVACGVAVAGELCGGTVGMQ